MACCIRFNNVLLNNCLHGTIRVCFDVLEMVWCCEELHLSVCHIWNYSDLLCVIEGSF